MKKFFKYYMVMGVISMIFFTGCMPQYSIQSSYNNQTHLLKIGNYKIKNAILIKKKNLININTIAQNYKLFSSTDKDCKKLGYLNYDISPNMYFLSSAYDDLQTAYNNKCQDEKIGNLHFLKCNLKYRNIGKYGKFDTNSFNYAITSSKSRDGGYESKTTIYLGNEVNCFEDIKQYFLNSRKYR